MSTNSEYVFKKADKNSRNDSPLCWNKWQNTQKTSINAQYNTE